MEVIRTVQTVENGRVLLNLPSEFSGREVEIIVLTRDPAKQKKSLRGALQKYARPEFIPQEPSTWENAVEEKYGDRFLNGAFAPASRRDFEAVASVSLQVGKPAQRAASLMLILFCVIFSMTTSSYQ